MSEEAETRPVSSLPTLGETPPIRKSALLRKISTDKTPPVDNYRDIRGYVTMYMEKHEKELVLNKHEKAEEVHQMMVTFSRNAQRSLFDRRCKTTLNTLRSRLETTTNEESDFQEETTENIKSLETECQKRYDSMKERQEKELKEMMDRRPDSTPANYRRRSPGLLTKMRQERRLFFQSRFDEAAALRAECEMIDKEEDEKQYAQAIAHWDAELKHLKARHVKEEAAMQLWIQTRHEEYERDAQKQFDALNKRKKLLDFDLSDTKHVRKSATPHLIRRRMIYENTQPRGPLINPSRQETVDKLSASLPPRAREILLKLQ